MDVEKKEQVETIPLPTVVDAPVQRNSETTTTTVKPEINLNVDMLTAINLNVMEYDKKIAVAEAVVADLKKKRAAYIYDANVESLISQAKQQQNNQQQQPPLS